MATVRIDTRLIIDWSSFHEVFATVFGFPDYYGRNMDAWIDCMTYLNDPEVVDTVFKSNVDEITVLQLENVKDLRKRCPEIYDAIIECSAFVNFRQLEQGRSPVLALSFWA